MGLTYQSTINRELTTMSSHPIAFSGIIQTKMVLLQVVLMMKTMMLMMRWISKIMNDYDEVDDGGGNDLQMF